MQILREVPEGSAEDTVRFWRVLVQIPCEVPEGSSADTWLGSRGTRPRRNHLMRFRRV